MSIILATNRVMLTDSKSSWGTIISCDPEKVRRIGEDIVGVVGDVGLSSAFFDWYGDDDADEAVRGAPDQRVDALILTAEGLFWSEGHHPLIMPVHEAAWAIGDGMPLALGALWAGASVLEAMAIVCERSTTCGWPIRWFVLGESGGEGIVTREQYLMRFSEILAYEMGSAFSGCLAEVPYPKGVLGCQQSQ